MPRRPKRGERIIAMSLRKCFNVSLRSCPDRTKSWFRRLSPGDWHSPVLVLCAFMKNDVVVLGSMEAQRWRQHPPEFGRAATFVESVELPLVEELTLKFLRAN